MFCLVGRLNPHYNCMQHTACIIGEKETKLYYTNFRLCSLKNLILQTLDSKENFPLSGQIFLLVKESKENFENGKFSD